MAGIEVAADVSAGGNGFDLCALGVSACQGPLLKAKTAVEMALPLFWSGLNHMPQTESK